MPGRTRSKRAKNPNGEMGLSDHLRELRNRIAVCLVVLLIAAVAAFNFADDIVDVLLEIGRGCGYQFVYIAPQELLIEYFSVALIIAVCVTIPLLLYEVWAFMRPGLKKTENLAVGFAMVFGVIFFCIGVVFAYKLMVPFMISFLASIDTGSSIAASISVQNYVSFLMTIFIIFGVVFELPVISVILTAVGILKAEWLKKGQKVAIVVVFVIAAVITPPDVVSQIMVAIPMIGLYELSIVLCMGVEKIRRRKQPEDGEEFLDEEGAKPPYS